MISLLLSARASYTKLQPVIATLFAEGHLLEIVACGSALLHRYGSVVTQVEQDWPFITLRKIYATYEGATPETSAKEIASLLSSLTDHYSTCRPRLVVVVADRHETIAASLAAASLNIPLAHLQGGEVSGNIDDRIRDCNTILATLHFPCTARAALRVSMLAKRGSTIHHVGCPSIDLAKAALLDPPAETTLEFGGVGPIIDFRYPFALCLLHPETEHPELAGEQMACVLDALVQTDIARVVLWPGQDAGAEAGAKVIRELVQALPQQTWHLIRTIPPRRFLRVLSQATVLVGNSSAGIREGSYLGTPVVNVGPRQAGRERGPNVMDVDYDPEQITSAIQAQRSHGRYPSSTLYGRGDAGPRIAEVLAHL